MRTALVSVAMFLLGTWLGSGLTTSAASQSSPTTTEGQFVTGIGGVFFKAADAAKLRAWYREHLGIGGGAQGTNFFWQEEGNARRFGRTVWSVFPKDTKYFGSREQNVMINYRVRDLDQLLTRLRAQGVRQVGTTEEYWYGRFAWIVDGEGSRVELWQPVSHSREEFEQQMKRRGGSDQ